MTLCAFTGVQPVAVSARIPSTFRADHPFYYMIKKKDAGILFAGTYSYNVKDV